MGFDKHASEVINVYNVNNIYVTDFDLTDYLLRRSSDKVASTWTKVSRHPVIDPLWQQGQYV